VKPIDAHQAKITRIKSEATQEYSDGDRVETYLLNLFKKGLNDEDRRNILLSDPEWAIYYHLAYERKNLIGWYPFRSGSSVLEVGSGCGSITESLVENKDITIVSNELSERRAQINYYRNIEAHNLEIVVGNLNDYAPKNKFDYIVCVGVFEYAGMFINSKNPYEAFLEALARLLKPGGFLLLAIENQLGFKYLAGAKEDHTGSFMDGINDYPQKKAVRTFGKEELTNRLQSAGFRSSYFYYPYPDYKLPAVVYSDDYYPGKDDVRFPRVLLPTPNRDQPREYTFSEAAFLPIVERNNLFREFSNSFLVEAML
jgi:2-polyprenyl-3-methyl-5-hydroxy-6-metoxy-1,4-benzoquinol methylase